VVRLSLRVDRRTTVLLSLLFVGQAGLVAVTALSQRWLVDSALHGSRAGVAVAVAVGAAAYGFVAVRNRIQQNLTLYLTGRVTSALNDEILYATAAIPTVTHLEYPPYLDRLGRLVPGSRSLATLGWTLFGAAAAVASLVASVFLLVAVHPALSLLPLLAAAPLLAARHGNRIIRAARDAAAELNRHEQRIHQLCTTPGPAADLIAAGAGDELVGRAARLWDAAAAREGSARLRAAAWQAAGWLLFAAGFAGALFVTAELVHSGRASLGDAVLVITLATALQLQVRTTVDNLTQLAVAGEVIGHYWWLRDHARDQARPGGPAPAVLRNGIRLDDVRYRYPGAGREVLRGVHLTLPAGTTVAVVGANGSGKTTLIKLLTGVCEPTGGTITVDGQPLSGVARSAWQADVSAVFQDAARFAVTAGEVVGLGDVRRLHDRAAVEAAVDRAGAGDIVAALPDGPGTPLGARFGGVELSAGQWQKLAVARSFMRATPLCLVLDEPAASLDPAAEQDLFEQSVRQARAAAARGAITILVTHRFTTVRMADLIVVLDEGRVAELGTHADLLRSGGTYAELYRLQERAYASTSTTARG
jgi:ATP-binding cassette subfamily B protein